MSPWQGKGRQHLNIQNNQLERTYLVLLNHLIEWQPPSLGQIMDDVPMLEEEVELEEVQNC